MIPGDRCLSIHGEATHHHTYRLQRNLGDPGAADQWWSRNRLGHAPALPASLTCILLGIYGVLKEHARLGATPGRRCGFVGCRENTSNGASVLYLDFLSRFHWQLSRTVGPSHSSGEQENRVYAGDCTCKGEVTRALWTHLLLVGEALYAP